VRGAESGCAGGATGAARGGPALDPGMAVANGDIGRAAAGAGCAGGAAAATLGGNALVVPDTCV